MMSMVSRQWPVVKTLRWAKREQLPVLSYGFPPAQRDWPFCLSSGKVEAKNLHPVKFFAKESEANLTGATNPVHPVK
jgi:hypothetical protein